MMESSLKFAAVDIGSNAVRLFFGYVFETEFGPVFKKASLVRLPIRLGEDSFHHRKIQQSKIDELIEAMKAFDHLKKAFHVTSYKVCATSAMRDAINGKQIVAEVLEETGIEIELISGDEEASLIFENHIEENLDSEQAYLYMDVGGGSTELTLFREGKKVKAKSFNIGTIRLKEDLVPEDTWQELKLWLNEIKLEYAPKNIIGSGGNINTLFKLTQRQEMEVFPQDEVKAWHRRLKVLSFDEKISKLGLRADRADVIVSATELFLFALSKSGCEGIIVPKVGLVDGIIQHLYKEYKNAKK
ncbi:MAG: exopolyphosphatase [Flavobacteriales bacterium]|nr:exopolyphosphatase [Flavobacteriales bacterium]